MSIQKLTEIQPNKWLATYKGSSGIYTVRLIYKNMKIIESSCDCPSYKQPCKHISIIENEIKKNKSIKKIKDKLDFWKKRLLDLGKHNRLIKSPLLKEGDRVQRHSLLITEPSTEHLWLKLIVEDGKSISFPVPLKNNEDDLEILSFSSGIQTNQSPQDTYKTLLNLMKVSKQAREETGLNTLYLAFGFLYWIENNISNQEIRSPLVLVPVKLSQNGIFAPIILSRSEEEITENLTLKEKFLYDFNLELPSFSEETKLSDYLYKVEMHVKNMVGKWMMVYSCLYSII